MSDRRSFLKQITAAGTAWGMPSIIPCSALGTDGSPAPGNRITMGAIGLGAKGRQNMRAFLHNPAVRMLAVCDVDRDRRDESKQQIDAEYGNTDCRTYLDFRELLARGDLDAVCIALPDHWHAIPAIAAARAGIDVYGEKPFARSIREGRAMCDAIERYGIVWQTGSQQRSGDSFRHACELVRNGRIGKVDRVEVGLGTGPIVEMSPVLPVPDELDWNFWLGPAPWRPYQEFGGKGGKCHYNWRWMLDYSGGKLTDWAGHHVDIAHWGLGLERTGPVRVKATGGFPEEGMGTAPVSFDITLEYASGVEIRAASDLERGVRWFGEDGQVFVTRKKYSTVPGNLWDEIIGPEELHLYRSTSGHHGNFLECVRSRRETVAPAEIGHRSISAGLLGEIAMLTGRPFEWNPDTEEIVGDPGASALLGRAYREPWQL